MKFLIACALTFGLFIENTHAQSISNLLNFDNIPADTPLSNEYQSIGISAISGAIVTQGSSFGIMPRSGANVVYADSGLMIFSFSATNVIAVSAYITGPSQVGIYAYDSSGNELGKSLTPSNGNNIFLSVNSPTKAIAKVEIHNGGSSFFVDDFAFTTGTVVSPVPVCRAAAEDAYNMVAAYPASAYIRAKTASADRSRLLFEVSEFEKLRAKGKVSQKLLSAALGVIQADVKFSVKSPQNQPLLQKLDQINKLIKANACQ